MDGVVTKNLIFKVENHYISNTQPRRRSQLVSENPQNNVLETILRSDIFKEKELYQKLLRYLVKAYQDNEIPKEVTIAHDVFHKGNDFNAAEDTSVRVHMHNLRKKLEEYYQTEGASDALKLFIPKGHYRVKFIQNNPSDGATDSWVKRNRIPILSWLLCLLLITIFVDKVVLHNYGHSKAVNPEKSKIWSSFFDNGFRPAVVIGDFLVFHEWDERLNRSRRIQDYEINTQDEFKVYIEAYPENYPEPWDLGELPHNSIYNIRDILPVFQAFKARMDIYFTSDVDINFIKNRNIVYIGEFKNLRALSDLIVSLPIHHETLHWWNGTLSFRRNDSLITLTTSRDFEKSRYVTDLGLVAKLPGQNNENYLIFAGFGYDAQIKIVELLSQKKSLQEFERKIIDRHGSVPDYFSAVFEVKGFDRASTTADLKFFASLNKEQYLKGLIP